MPNLQPVLAGERVGLRPMAPEDWAGLYAAASDPAIWAMHPEPDRWREPVFRRYFEGGLTSGGALTIREADTGRVIGSSRYHGWDADSREVEIGWTFLVRDHWGGRTNAEVKRLMVGHAFTFAETVLFWVGPDNLRSRRAVEKLGGALRPGLHHRPGVARGPIGHVVYELRRP